MRRLPVTSHLRLAVITVGILLVAGGGGVATACKVWLDCHTGSSPSLEHEIQRYQGKASGIKVLREDLTVDTVAKGFTYPTDFAFLGKSILVAERDGRIMSVSTSGVVSKVPLLDLRRVVDQRYFRGILGMAVDPDFQHHPYLYVAYTPLPRPSTSRPTVVRLSRFTIRDDRLERGSERVIVGHDDARPCARQPATADCLPSPLDVDGLDIAFGKDRTLFISTGYGGGLEGVERSAFEAQDIDTLGGKVLHVDRDGRGLAVNPYWNGDPAANRSKVWAVGLRNPFRMALVGSAPTTLLVGNVGWDWRETLYRVVRGGDYGWPCYEARLRTPHYNGTAFCRTYYRAHPRPPAGIWLSIPHPKAITMVAGVSLADARELPADLRRDFVFADWGKGQIWVARTTALHSPVVTEIARNSGGPVRFRIGPDGALYYLAANSGQLRRISLVRP